MIPTAPNTTESPDTKADSQRHGCGLVLTLMAPDLFGLLLIGYLIFNRSFATIGFPPVYIGEMVLAFTTVVALFNFKTVFIESMRTSRTMCLIAFFILYGTACAALDFPAWGLSAARDAVICLYAIAAFLAPWLLEISIHRLKNSSDGNPKTLKNVENRIARKLFRVLTVFLVPAIAWGWLICKGWIRAPASLKVDFLTLSAATGCVIYFNHVMQWSSLAALAYFRRREDDSEPSQTWLRERWAFPVTLALWVASIVLVFCLPTRAIQVSVVILTLGFMIIASRPFWPRSTLLLSVYIVAAIAFVGGAGWYISQNSIVRERIETLVDPDEHHFATREAQVAAHSVKWRLVFWRHCIDETLHRSPVFGLGFGTNLTDLMRGTPDWPMFEDSQNAEKYGSPNRHPHSAHVTIFTRLGILGAALWIAILCAVLTQGLINCRDAREAILIGRERTRCIELFAIFGADTAILGIWLIYVFAMSFGVVLENPFGGIWFWTLTGVIANRRNA